MYIIWNYDGYPFQLCGKVDKKQKDGYYTVIGYSGYQFKARTIIRDDKKGKQAYDLLQKYTKKHYKAKIAFRERWYEKIHSELFYLSGELKITL